MSNVLHLFRRSVTYCTVLYCTLLMNNVAFGQCLKPVCTNYVLEATIIAPGSSACNIPIGCDQVAWQFKLIRNGVAGSSSISFSDFSIGGSITSDGPFSRLNSNISIHCLSGAAASPASFSVDPNGAFSLNINYTVPNSCITVDVSNGWTLFTVVADAFPGETLSLDISTFNFSYQDRICDIETSSSSPFLDISTALSYTAPSLPSCSDVNVRFDMNPLQQTGQTGPINIPFVLEDAAAFLSGGVDALELFFQVENMDLMQTPIFTVGSSLGWTGPPTLVSTMGNISTFRVLLTNITFSSTNSPLLFTMHFPGPVNQSQASTIELSLLACNVEEMSGSGCCSPKLGDNTSVSWTGFPGCSNLNLIVEQGFTNNLEECQNSVVVYVENPNQSGGTIGYSYLSIGVQLDFQNGATFVGIENGGFACNASPSQLCTAPNYNNCYYYDQTTSTLYYCTSLTSATTMPNGTGIRIIFDGKGGCLVGANVVKGEIRLAGTSQICALNPLVNISEPICLESLEGEIATETGVEAPNVVIDIQENNNNCFVLLDHNIGVIPCIKPYSACVCKGGTNTYSITPTYEGTVILNGVTTFDIVLISRHILDIAYLDSPYKIIAADANGSNGLTTADLVAIRRAILLVDTGNKFNNGNGRKSWIFVARDYIFPNNQNPFSPGIGYSTSNPFPQTINSADVSSSNDFVAIKVGDVNGTAMCDAGHQRPSINGNFCSINTATTLVEKDVWKVAFRVDSEDAIVALQSELKLVNGTIEGVVAGEVACFDKMTSHQVDKNLIRIAWAQTDGKSTLGKDELFFTLLVRSKESPVFIEGTSEGMPTVAFDIEGNAFNVELSEDTKQHFDPYTGMQVKVFPNPVVATEPLGLLLQSSWDGTATVRIRSADGSYSNEQRVNCVKDVPLLLNFDVSASKQDILYYQILHKKGQDSGIILLSQP